MDDLTMDASKYLHAVVRTSPAADALVVDARTLALALAEFDAARARVPALEAALRAFVDADGLPPGWVTRSANTEPLTCCGHCGALAAYFPSQRLWECDHHDDCPVAAALALLEPGP